MEKFKINITQWSFFIFISTTIWVVCAHRSSVDFHSNVICLFFSHHLRSLSFVCSLCFLLLSSSFFPSIVGAKFNDNKNKICDQELWTKHFQFISPNGITIFDCCANWRARDEREREQTEPFSLLFLHLWTHYCEHIWELNNDTWRLMKIQNLKRER